MADIHAVTEHPHEGVALSRKDARRPSFKGVGCLGEVPVSEGTVREDRIRPNDVRDNPKAIPTSDGYSSEACVSVHGSSLPLDRSKV